VTLKNLIKKITITTKVDQTKFYQKLLYLIYFWQFRKNFFTFSQTGEDIIIRQFIPENNGSYIDIGSGDPILENNTYHLYRRGWNGFLIDPILNNHLKNIKFRPRDKSILGICGENVGEKDFNQTIPYQFSHVSVGSSIQSKEVNNFIITKSYKVKQIDLQSLNISVQPTNPFLVSIDVEGFEIDVLNGIDWKIFQPRVFLVEQHLDLSPELNFVASIPKTEVGMKLSSNNYRCMGYTGLTSVWVHQNYLDVKLKY
jgi:FkbM family methyltransferase